MNLFYTINDTFVPQMGAAICSVCENNRNATEIVFYIGALEVTEEHQRELQRLTDRYDRRIVFIPIDHLREKLGFDFDTLGWNEVVLARLLVDRLLPNEVQRVIYLDGDTIVVDSLRELWKLDLEGNPMGASIEPTANRDRKKAIGLENDPYYNAGVLLIDLNEWREQMVTERVLAFYQEHGGKLFANDQDAINGAMRGKIKTISPRYNYYNIFWYYPYKALVKMMRPAKYLPPEVLRDAAEHPCVIHYLGEDRPWRKGNTHIYSGEFWKYLEMTPWKNLSMEEGWELYFRFYRAFWILLKPFPMLQYRIIDALIPAMMKYRKRVRTKSSDQKS